MSHIPVELLLAIVDSVEDTAVLFNVRLASKTFNAVATPPIFRVLSVRDSVRSAEGLACLQAGGTATRNAVQEIVFDGDLIGGDNWSDEHITVQPGRDALFAAFSGLAKFCNLRILHFEFHAQFRELETTSFPDNPSHLLLLQIGLLYNFVLATRPPPPLTSLTLHHLIPMPHNIYATEAFQNLFRPLKTLDVSVLSEYGSHVYEKSPLCDFWKASVPSLLKNATNVTSLTLRSGYPVGVRPALALASIHLPVLTALSLHNFVLDSARADYDVAEFILCHKVALRHLDLSDCYVYGGEGEMGVYPRPWHDVLQRFKEELSSLRSFRMTDTSNGYSAYVCLHRHAGYYTFDDEAVPLASDLDVAALQSLQSVVESRSTL
ncbi:hypothetical protein K438DRAFT_1884996 [Mycena galopus ATCC 62051]|nr:hypothetical protein K438DRAFT_1884996 [Mycena galopus ATCC 62051]